MLVRQNNKFSNLSELYHIASGVVDAGAYDGFNNLQQFARGTLVTQGIAPRLNAISGAVANQSWGHTSEGQHRRNMPPDDTKDRPMFQGSFDEEGVENKLEAWSAGHSGYEPAYALSVRFDMWGNVVEQKDWHMDWVLLNEATLLATRTYEYDALGRRISEPGRLLYWSADGNVIEDREVSATGPKLRQYVWSGAGGNHRVLRDVDSDGNPATRYDPALPTGIDQRFYAITDASGNITTITGWDGNPVERYLYTPEGRLEIRTGDMSTALTSSAHGWGYTYQSGRRDGEHLYYVEGQVYDYLTANPVQPDPASYWGILNEMRPPSLSWYDRTVLFAAPVAIGVVIGVATGGLGFLAAGALRGLAGGFAGGFTTAYGSGAGVGDSLKVGAIGGAIGGVAGGLGGALAGRIVGGASNAAIRGAGQSFGVQLGREALSGAVEGAAGGLVEGGYAGWQAGGLSGMVSGAATGALYGAGIGAATAGAFKLSGPALRLAAKTVSPRTPRTVSLPVIQSICFVAGTSVLTGDGGKIDIEDIRVGQRLATDGGVSNSGLLADDPDATAVDASTWRLVSIHAEQAWADGTLDRWEVQTLQPADWLAMHQADVGGWIDLSAVLDLAEMGAPQGLRGRIVSVGPTPEIEDGPGRVVTTTVNHLNNFVFQLTLQAGDGELETLGVTGWHKFYDEADGWQSVCELRLGDVLRDHGGRQVTVVGLTRDEEVQRVYNMTVEADHVYYVGDLTTLAHNNYCGATFGELDHLGRPTGVMVDITPQMLGHGTSASASIRPPGFGGGQLGHARGHLWGRQLGGPGDDVRNLVTLLQNPSNTPAMRGFENAVRAAVEAGENIRYWSIPVYRGSNPMPIGITLRARGSAGFTLDVSVLN